MGGYAYIWNNSTLVDWKFTVRQGVEWNKMERHCEDLILLTLMCHRLSYHLWQENSVTGRNRGDWKIEYRSLYTLVVRKWRKTRQEQSLRFLRPLVSRLFTPKLDIYFPEPWRWSWPWSWIPHDLFITRETCLGKSGLYLPVSFIRKPTRNVIDSPPKFFHLL